MIVPLLGIALLQGVFVDTQEAREPADPQPDTVVVAPAGPLQERWTWAERTARDRFDAYWIGWTVSGDPTGARWYYIDRGVPVAVGSSVIVGTFQMSGSVGGITFQGVPLESVVGPADPHGTVVLLRYEVADGRAALSRVHVGSFAFPVHFDGGALLWLGGGDDGASVPLLEGAYAETAEERLRRDLASAVAAHRSGAPAPLLREWLSDPAQPSAVRRIAADGLANLVGAGAADALTQAMRNDTSASVRSAAARALARSAEPATAVAELSRMARDDADRAARRNAVSAIGTIQDPVAFDALVAIIDAPVDTVAAATRRAALSSVLVQARRPSTPASQEVLDLLERAALADADGGVRRQAISSMASLRDARVTPILVRIAGTHADAATRRSAVNTLADAQPRSDALAALRNLAWDHESADTQRAAVNALSRMDGDDVRTLLAQLAESHPRPDVRRSALRAVVELDTRGGGR